MVTPLTMPHKGYHYTQGHILDRINVSIGYPPRATTGSYHVTVRDHEVGTPKMDADSEKQDPTEVKQHLMQ